MTTQDSRKPRTVAVIAALAVCILLLLILSVSGIQWVSNSAAVTV